MPYSQLSEVPGGLKSVAQRPGGPPISLTLSQANKLAAIYDALIEDGKDKETAARMAKAKFRSMHKVEGGKWVVRKLKESVQAKLDECLDEFLEVGKRHSKKDNQMLREIIKLAQGLLNKDDLQESGVAELDAKIAQLLKDRDPNLEENSWGFTYKARDWDEFLDGSTGEVTIQEEPLVSASYGVLKTAAEEDRLTYALRTLEFRRDSGWTHEKVMSWLGENLQESIRVVEAKKFKTEGGVQYPAEAYAYVPDPDTPTTWKLRLWDKTKKLSAEMVGAAISAFSAGGHRGKKVQIPSEDVAKVKAKIRAAWKKVNPDKDEDLMPKHFQESADDPKDGVHPKDRTDLTYRTTLAEASYDRENGDLVCDLVEAGKSQAKPRFYTQRAIQEAAGLYKGAKMYLDHPTEREKRDRPERSVKDWASTVMESWPEDGRVKGRVHVHDPWLRERLADPVFRAEVGLSHVVDAYAHVGPIHGEQMQIVESIQTVKSVDWVTEPAQGGRVAQMLESRRNDMEELKTLTYEDLKDKRPDILAKHLEESAKDKKTDEPNKELKELKETVEATKKKVEAIEGSLSKATQMAEVQRIVGEKKLSEPVAKRVVSLLESESFEDDPKDKKDGKTALQKLHEAVDETVKAEQAYIASVSGKPWITGGPGKSVSLVESLQDSLDKRMGVSDVKIEESDGPQEEEKTEDEKGDEDKDKEEDK